MMPRRVVIACALTLLSPAPGWAQEIPATVTDASFRAFLKEFQAATLEMMNGEATRWRNMESGAADASFFNPFGVVALGSGAVDSIYRGAVKRFVPGMGGSLRFDNFLAGSSGDIGYAIYVQRATVQHTGADTSRVLTMTRVTNIFRREDGAWKLLHRHMDHLDVARCQALGPPGC